LVEALEVEDDLLPKVELDFQGLGAIESEGGVASLLELLRLDDGGWVRVAENDCEELARFDFVELGLGIDKFDDRFARGPYARMALRRPIRLPSWVW
jgi:hypothetical protein